MALPTFKAAGTFTAGTGAITPPYPAAPNDPVAGDIALLVCESENQAISLTTANGFVELGAQANKAAGTAATDPASRLAVYWKRCVGGDAAPVVADSGNHTTGQIYLFSGCIPTGDPWNVYAEGNDGGANDLTGVVPGATTTVADCLIVLISTSSYNGTSTTEFSGWTNGDLANILERGDNTNTAGLGGGHGLATGEKATAGAYGNTTVTLAHTSYKGAMSIALKSAPAVFTLTAESGAFSLVGMAANLVVSFLLGAATVLFVLTGGDAGLARGYIANADSGVYAETGTSVGLVKGSVISADSATLAVSGTPADLLASRTLNVEPGGYGFTGGDAGLLKSSVLPAAAGGYDWTGTDGLLLKASTLSGEAGVYAWTGTDATLSKFGGGQFTLDAVSGNYSWTGTAAGLNRGFTLLVDPGAYGWTGSEGDLLAHRILGAEAADYSWTGTSVALVKASVLAAESGGFNFPGTSADLLWGRVLTADSANYPWTGSSADLIYGPIEGATLFADPGNYGWEATPAELLESRVLEAGAGNYSFVGGSANLWRPQVPEKGFSLPGRAKGTGLGKRPKGWETPPRKKGF